jgi:hypothetical protein
VNEGQIALPDSPKVVTHLVPATAICSGQQLDLEHWFNKSDYPKPVYALACSHRLNADGLLVEGTGRYEGSYVQIFHDGKIEAVCANLLKPSPEGQKVIAGWRVGSEIIDSLNEYMAYLHKIAVHPPFSVFLSFLGVRDWFIASAQHEFAGDPIDRDDLQFDEVQVADFSIAAPVLLRPAFDRLWQASNLTRCSYYDQDGNWTR